MLAFSTVSQIGYMFLAVGSGAYMAAIFLMVAHAFFKGLLFLGAGSVIHGLARRAGPQADGRPAPLHASRPSSPSPSAGWPSPASRRCPGSGPRATCSRTPGRPLPAAVGDRPRHRRAHRLLHEPAARPGLLRRATAGDKVPMTPAPTGDATPRRHHRAARVALGHAPARWSSWPSSPSSAACWTCPGSTHFSLSNWLAPVFGGNLYNDHLSTGAMWALGRRPTWSAAVIGVIIGLRLCGAAPGRPAGARAGVPPAASGTVDELYDAVIGRPGQRLAAFCAWVVDARGHRRRGQRHGHAGPADRVGQPRRLQTGYVRNYVLGHRARPGWCCRLHAEPDVVGLMSTAPFPFLTVLILLPAVGAAVLALLGLDQPVCQGVPRGRRPRPCRWSRWCCRRRAAGRQCKVQRRRLPAGLRPHLGQVARASTGTSGVDGISLFLVLLTGGAVPAGHARCPGATREPAVLRGLDAAAGGGRAWGASSPST